MGLPTDVFKYVKDWVEEKVQRISWIFDNARALAGTGGVSNGLY